MTWYGLMFQVCSSIILKHLCLDIIKCGQTNNIFLKLECFEKIVASNKVYNFESSKELIH